MNRIKAAIYCRVSPSSNEEALISLCRKQKSILMDRAAASNFEVTDCYQDIGYSGRNMNRPGLQRMLRDHRDGKFTIVLVYNRDRLVKGMPTEIPDWPFPILSATPISDFERKGEKIARYMRTGKTSKKLLTQQRKDVKRTAKKYGYR